MADLLLSFCSLSSVDLSASSGIPITSQYRSSPKMTRILALSCVLRSGEDDAISAMTSLTAS